MGITKTPDGRYLVGKGISDANNYKGALGKRDILIQYTADGVTTDSMNSLLYLVDYATSHGEANELIVPPGISIWVAKNDKLTAVEADDIYIDDDAFHIGPISYDGEDWTFGDPTDTGGSFPTPTEDDDGKVLTAGADGTASWQTASGGGGGVIHVGASALDSMADAPDSSQAASEYDTGYYSGGVTYDGNVIPARFYFEYSDSDINGLPLVNTADYGEGLTENSFMNYVRYGTAQSLIPASEDPDGAYYMLTPADTVTYTVMPLAGGGVQALAVVLPANTPFKWVKRPST